MTTLREAAQMALRALIARAKRGDGAPDTVAALRTALAQEQEQDMSNQPEALRLAKWCEAFNDWRHDKVADELRRLHALNAELLEALRWIECRSEPAGPTSAARPSQNPHGSNASR